MPHNKHSVNNLSKISKLRIIQLFHTPYDLFRLLLGFLGIGFDDLLSNHVKLAKDLLFDFSTVPEDFLDTHLQLNKLTMDESVESCMHEPVL